MNTNHQIQTVHGFSHPITVESIGSEETESSEPPSPQRYRKDTVKRLEQVNRAALNQNENASSN